jgi:Flp pilus assembly protein CpaB
VDVVANLHYTVQRGQGNEIRRVASRVILRNILVLEDPKTAGGGLGGGSKKAITLAVTDSQAQKLFFAMKNGDLMLILRPVAKPNDSPDSVETIDSILGDGLGLRQLFQLTGGVGLKDVNGQ